MKFTAKRPVPQRETDRRLIARHLPRHRHASPTTTAAPPRQSREAQTRLKGRSRRQYSLGSCPACTSEPLLIPKLRSALADFLYLHCSIDQRLFTLETCCGLGTDLGEIYCASLGFSRSRTGASDSRKDRELYRNNVPFSG